jgi:hypothetical protein
MTPCPVCGGPLERVTYSVGYLNRDQWESTRAGDWCCESCPETVGSAGRARTGYAYFWDRDVVTPERFAGGAEAMFRFLVWVWCEGTATQRDAWWVQGGEESEAHFERREAFTEAIERGSLRLDWRRP